VWDGRDVNGHMVASGIYFYEMKIGSFYKMRKSLMLK
jgi:hypothetical protein